MKKLNIGLLLTGAFFILQAVTAEAGQNRIYCWTEENIDAIKDSKAEADDDIDPSDDFIEPGDNFIDPSDDFIEPGDNFIDPGDYFIEPGDNFTFGLRGGANLATFTGDNARIYPGDVAIEPGDNFIEPESTTGISAGLFANFYLGRSFFLRPEILYSQKGAIYSDSLEGMVGDTTYRREYEGAVELEYLEFPLLAGINILQTGNIYFGPSIGMLINAEETEKEDIYINDEFCEENSRDERSKIEDVSSLDLGLAAGTGFRLGKLSIEARYTLSMATIWEDLEDEETGDKVDWDIRNSVISLLVGYTF